jgi:SH3-like domain-containing protein
MAQVARSPHGAGQAGLSEKRHFGGSGGLAAIAPARSNARMRETGTARTVRNIRAAVAAAMIMGGAGSAGAQSADAVQGLSGLPVPRFVSLAASEANMRSGPGDRYPITWVYTRRGLPMEVLREYGIWRQVRDPSGTTGWMNKNLLSGDRTAYVTRTVRALHASGDISAPVVWRVQPGVVGSIVLCEQAWCQIRVEGKSGYILRDQTWGTYKDERVG